ncbi:hypothetical protein JHK84_034680 [Glycine max]|nr:hypothetical protein JHK84_034680 [Glycine max]
MPNLPRTYHPTVPAAGNNRNLMLICLQKNSECNEWQASVLQEPNVVKNVHRWACG